MRPPEAFWERSSGPSKLGPLHFFQREARPDAAVQIKGTKSGLLLHLYERPLTGAVAELRDRLSSLPGFYKGSRAVLMLGAQPASGPELAAVIATLEQFGISADGAVCDSEAVAGLARSAGLRIVAASVAAAPRVRDDRTKPVSQRTPDERKERPHHHERRRHGNGHLAAAIERSLETMLFYKGTLRSGQSLNAAGNIVVLGDVNPGAELVATGDIVVWGALRGVAHAGAEGDDSASVYALRLEPTQLRISRFVAVAPDDRRRRHGRGPEAARIKDGRILIDRET